MGARELELIRLSEIDICRNCGKEIRLGPPSPDPYWYHPTTESVYCWQASALPVERTIRATPKHG